MERLAQKTGFFSGWGSFGRLTILVMVGGVLVAGSRSEATPSGLGEVIRVQRELRAADPTNVTVLNDLGNLLALAGEVEEAEQVYLEALEMDPDHVSTRFNLALLYQETGRRRPAKRAYEAVLKLDPEHAWGHYQLGRLLAESGNRRKAVEHYSRAFLLDSRLTLADFNPHIVDNELAVHGVLRAYSGQSTSTLTPREYEHPDQLRALLVPQAPEPEEAQEQVSGSREEETQTLGPADLRALGPAGSASSPPTIIPEHRKGKGARGHVPEWAREETEPDQPPGAERASDSAREPQASPSPVRSSAPAGVSLPPSQAQPQQPPLAPLGGETASPQLPGAAGEPQPEGEVRQPQASSDEPQSEDPGRRSSDPLEDSRPEEPDPDPDVFSTGRLELRLIPMRPTGVGMTQRAG